MTKATNKAAPTLVYKERSDDLNCWFKIWQHGKQFKLTVLFDRAEGKPWTLSEKLPTEVAARGRLKTHKKLMLENRK